MRRAPEATEDLVAAGGQVSAASTELTFPDVPRLELEDLITQLTERAQDVLAAQGRLRALIRANATVVRELRLKPVLRHTVEAARELVGARYAALGIVGPNGRLEEFVHVGMDDGTVDRVGHLPDGHGILGLLITHPEPIRLTDLHAHPAAVGFPPHHPPMVSFLGVPIRVRDQVYGNLYLTESARGEFTEEDEQLIVALAASAGVAIENARLYEESEQRRLWLAASSEVTQELFAEHSEPPLELVLRHAARGAGADIATLVLPTEGGHWHVGAATGPKTEQIVGHVVNLTHSMVGGVISSGKPVLISDYEAQLGRVEDLDLEIGSAMGAPLLDADDCVVGAVTVARLPGRVTFREEDLEQLAGFSGHVGIAMSLERARSDRESMRILADHDRIAADLHDHVIQELFAVGMGLQGLLRNLTRPEERARILGYVDALDATISRIRTTIFQVKSDREREDTLQRRLLRVIEEHTPGLGFHPEVNLNGPLNLGVPAELADDIVAVVRETVSNIARHANASTARIRVSLVGELVTIDAVDDGGGIGNLEHTSGLSNLRRRAEAHAGVLHLDEPPGGGTHLRWTGRVTGVKPT
jgi:signal transduction histidine kinase